ncbi:MAG: hypothetical protein OXF73_07605 [Gammaproteobacteria bacterium]|nr:hypothetical protein [Gammaproteobacteria bacterium]MCY4228352.1 hypothetical protein [Gammaproteobacteria bacterium]
MKELTTIANLITKEQAETAGIVFDALAPNTRRGIRNQFESINRLDWQ